MARAAGWDLNCSQRGYNKAACTKRERVKNYAWGVANEVLFCYLNAFPEGDVLFNVRGSIAGFRIITGGVLVLLAINDDRIIAGQTFLRAADLMLRTDNTRW